MKKQPRENVAFSDPTALASQTYKWNTPEYTPIENSGYAICLKCAIAMHNAVKHSAFITEKK